MNDEPLSVRCRTSQLGAAELRQQIRRADDPSARDLRFPQHHRSASGHARGEDAVVAEAHNFGLTTRIPAVPSIHIGAADVLLMDMVAAYTTFANMGVRCSPLGILRVEAARARSSGSPGGNARGHGSAHAWIILDALRDAGPPREARGAVVGGGFLLPAGGKIGTTNDGKDVWFIGFTPDLVSGVWMGFDNPTKIMGNAQGGRLAAPAWTAMMRDIYERRKARALGRARGPGRRADRQQPVRYALDPILSRSPSSPPYFIPGTEPAASALCMAERGRHRRSRTAVVVSSSRRLLVA
jgi:penicillin-binding protein 1A